MRRNRPWASTSPIDKEIQDRLTGAERLIREAMGICSIASKNRSNLAVSRQSALVKKDLTKVLGALSFVRLLTPAYRPEEEKLPPKVTKPKEVTPPPFVDSIEDDV